MSNSNKRPPIPSEVTVAWFWDEQRQCWSVDWADESKKKVIAAVRDGVFKHRHRYATYRTSQKTDGGNDE